MAISKISITNPQEPDMDVAMILESGSFGSIRSTASDSTGMTSDASTGSSSKPYSSSSSSLFYHHPKKTYSSTPQKLHYYHHQNSNKQQRHSSKRRKPNRFVLYLRNRTLSRNHQLRAYSISAVLVSFLLVSLTVQRLLSLYFTHRRWVNAPITYMHRSCPLPSYDLLYPTSPRTFAEQQQLQSSRALRSTSTTTSTSQQSPSSSSETNSDSSLSSASASSVSNTIDDNNNTAATIVEAESYDSPKLKICMTSLTDQKSPSFVQRLMRWRNFDGILNLTRPNKLAYAQKYGYHVYDGSDHYDRSRPPAWSKIRAVQALLEMKEGDEEDDTNNHKPCDWVLWMDADTVIMNSNVRIEDFLPADPTKDLIVVSDKGGGYNSGVFLFRNSLWSKQFLDEWWNMNDFVRHPGLSLSGDNAALKALLRTMEERNILDDHVLTPPRCTINSFAHFLTRGESMEIMDHLTEQPWYYDNEHYHKGDFIAHIPGFDNKAECLKLLLREAR